MNENIYDGILLSQLMTTPLFIEYDGRQHFSTQRFGGMTQDQADARFETQQLRDVMKNDYCLEKGYELLRIKYY